MEAAGREAVSTGAPPHYLGVFTSSRAPPPLTMPPASSALDETPRENGSLMSQSATAGWTARHSTFVMSWLDSPREGWPSVHQPLTNRASAGAVATMLPQLEVIPLPFLVGSAPPSTSHAAVMLTSRQVQQEPSATPTAQFHASGVGHHIVEGVGRRPGTAQSGVSSVLHGMIPPTISTAAPAFSITPIFSPCVALPLQLDGSYLHPTPHGGMVAHAAPTSILPSPTCLSTSHGRSGAALLQPWYAPPTPTLVPVRAAAARGSRTSQTSGCLDVLDSGEISMASPTSYGFAAAGAVTTSEQSGMARRDQIVASMSVSASLGTTQRQSAPPLYVAARSRPGHRAGSFFANTAAGRMDQHAQSVNSGVHESAAMPFCGAIPPSTSENAANNPTRVGASAGLGYRMKRSRVPGPTMQVHGVHQGRDQLGGDAAAAHAHTSTVSVVHDRNASLESHVTAGRQQHAFVAQPFPMDLSPTAALHTSYIAPGALLPSAPLTASGLLASEVGWAEVLASDGERRNRKRRRRGASMEEPTAEDDDAAPAHSRPAQGGVRRRARQREAVTLSALAASLDDVHGDGFEPDDRGLPSTSVDDSASAASAEGSTLPYRGWPFWRGQPSDGDEASDTSSAPWMPPACDDSAAEPESLDGGAHLARRAGPPNLRKASYADDDEMVSRLGASRAAAFVPPALPAATAQMLREHLDKPVDHGARVAAMNPGVKHLQHVIEAEIEFPVPENYLELHDWADGKGVRLSFESVHVLKTWFASEENWRNPYPTEAEKEELAQMSGLSLLQVSNWLRNERKRIWLPLKRQALQAAAAAERAQLRAQERGEGSSAKRSGRT